MIRGDDLVPFLMIALATSTETSPSPFHDAALDLLPYGLAVIPCRTRDSDDGEHNAKKPLLSGFNHWKRRPGQKTIGEWKEQFPEANIGVICGLSGITVVDVDGDQNLVETAIKMFGDTPLKIQTPRGGMHLYYRHDGERCAALRSSHGLAIDIKGRGGYVLVPPSIRLDGPHAGRRYEIISGSWNDIRSLPTMIPLETPSKSRATPAAPVPLRAIEVGHRNDMLFKRLLREARHVDCPEDLIDIARTFNDNLLDPLPDSEVVKTAGSAWRYEARGDNWAGRSARFEVTLDDLDAFEGDSDAIVLDAYLRLHHSARDKSFAVSPKAMKKAEMIPRWSVKRYTSALRKLVKIGALIQEYQGGKKRGDASLFTLGSGLKLKVPRKVPNITKHPPPSLPAPPLVLVENEVGRREQLGLDLVGGAGRPRRIDPVMFGRVVRQQREQHGLSQAQVAAMAGMSRSGVGNIETGTFPASPKIQHHLADLLGIDLGVAA
jgi:DNA-binding XRE family transcriptional regulator